MRSIAIALLIIVISGQAAAEEAANPKLPQFAYRVSPARLDMFDAPTPEETELLKKHYLYVKGLFDSGVVVFAGLTTVKSESTFGLIVFHAATADDARKIMEGDPAVASGIFRNELFPFRVSMMGKSPSDKRP